jgi:hypothetical protein|tara:strand:+ start:324 stop:944 length:621 start_codon:yes stop_codon:yes gene_type:complete
MTEDLLILITLLSAGIGYRIALQSSGHEWVKTYNQTITFILLPFITFIITKTIAGNIALSLGMIGALSIVRFRHPVKSALELVMYFNLITIGIATSVNIKYAAGLIITTILIIFLLRVFQLFFQRFNVKIFPSSFDDGNELNLIEIKSKQKNTEIENHLNLKCFSLNEETGEILYKLAFDSQKELKTFKKKIETNSSCKIINFEII